VSANTPPLNLVVFSNNDLAFVDPEIQAACLGADMVVSLGGVNLHALAEILPQGKPALAVLGPRDSREVPLPFQALHASGFTFRGWRIAGFSGSPRWRRESQGIYISEPEAEALLGQLPPCDLLLTHAPPTQLTEAGLRPELGFPALDRYLLEKPPIYHFYAHPTDEAAEEFGQSLSVGVCGYLKPPTLYYV
jgi:hypothetical protein